MKRQIANIIFFTLTLGSQIKLTLIGSSYNLMTAEAVLLLILTLWFLNGQTIKVDRQFKIIASCWFFVFLWGILGNYWSENSMRTTALSLSYLYGLLSFILGVAFFGKYRSPEILSTAIRVFSISLLVQLIYNYLIFYRSNPGYGSGISFNELYYGIKIYAAVTLMGSSNFIASFFSFNLLYEFFYRRKHSVIFVFVNIAGLLLTLSRGAILSIIAVSVFYTFYKFFYNVPTYERRQFLIKTISVIVILYLVLTQITSVANSTLLKSFTPEIFITTISSRLDLLNIAIQDIFKHFLFGTGLIWAESTDVNLFNAHNDLISPFRQQGIIGALPVLYIILYPFRGVIKGFKSIPLQIRAILLAYATVALHSLMEPTFYSTSSQIWLGFVLAYIIVNSRYLIPISENNIQASLSSLTID